MRAIGFLLGLWLACLPSAGFAQAPATPGPTLSGPTHGITILGTPALPPDFPNFPYVNPDAPKGGDITLSAVGTFDSFNPFIVRGNAAAGGQRVWETLLRNSVEEVATAYGALDRGYDLTLIKDAHTTGTIQLENGSKIEAASVVQEFNFAMTWVSYPGRKNGTATAEEVDFATPGGKR